jgi:hypothetical protein
LPALLLLLLWARPLGAQVPPAQGRPVGDAPAPAEAALARAFRRPLILGASVSADYRAPSPGRLLARRFSALSVATVAWPGAHSSSILAALPDQTLDSATVVVAVDIFFWDAARAGAARAPELVKAFFDRLGPRRLPLIVGTVPPLRLPYGVAGSPATGESRDAFNAEIRRLCGLTAGCAVVDLDRLYADAAAGRPLADGRPHRPESLTADGLHPNLEGSELIAAEILLAVARR